MKFYKFTYLVSIFILILLLMPPSGIPSVEIPHVDKFVHCGIFAFLSITFYVEHFFQYKNLPNIYYSTLLLISFAILTEILQYLSGYRTFDIQDIFADILGIILVTVFIRYVFWRYSNRKK